MTDTNFKARNHTVPEFYLRNFSQDGHSVREYRTLVHHASEPVWRDTAIKVLTRYQHFYTENSDGAMSDALERQFDAEFEIPARDSIYRAINGEQLTRENWSAMARFLALQECRTPVSLSRFLAAAPKLFDDATRSLREVFLGAFPDGIPQEALDAFMGFFDGFGIAGQFQPIETKDDSVRYEMRGNINRRTWLQFVKHALTGEPLEQLIAHRWTILHAAPGTTFLTSDNPVITIGKTAEGQWAHGNGWNRPHNRIFMPLDPHHLLFTAVAEKPPSRGTELTGEQVEFINASIARTAYRSIVGNDNNNYVPTYRQREVNRDKCASEKALWDEWHELHTRAETAGALEW